MAELLCADAEQAIVFTSDVPELVVAEEILEPDRRGSPVALGRSRAGAARGGDDALGGVTRCAAAEPR
jgi:hypothetical protein